MRTSSPGDFNESIVNEKPLTVFVGIFGFMGRNKLDEGRFFIGVQEFYGLNAPKSRERLVDLFLVYVWKSAHI